MTSDKAEFSFTPTDEAAAKYSVTVEVKITVTKTDPSPAPSLDYVIGDSATWVCQEQQMDIINRSSTDTMVIIHTRIEHGDNYYYGWVRHVVDTGIAMSYSVLSSNSHYNCHIANDNNVECWHRIPEYYLDSMYSDSVLRGTWSRSTNNIVDSVITDITTTLRFTQNAVTLSVQHSNPYRYESYSGSYMYPYENTAGRMSVKFYDQNWHYMGNVTDNNMLLKRHDLNNVPDNTSMQRFVRRR
jgi:hypothetical protein